jgi:hypothetical protein
VYEYKARMVQPPAQTTAQPTNDKCPVVWCIEIVCPENTCVALVRLLASTTGNLPEIEPLLAEMTMHDIGCGKGHVLNGRHRDVQGGPNRAYFDLDWM